jgi:hypothetical protein
MEHPYQIQEGFLFGFQHPPLKNTTITASPFATDWQKCNCNGTEDLANEMSLHVFSLFLLFLLFLLISLDVGFCDDIPLMVVRSFLIVRPIYFYFYSYLRLKTLCGREGYETRVDGRMGREGQKKKNRRNTRRSTFFWFLFPSFWFVVRWLWEKKKVCTVGFAFRREIDLVGGENEKCV